jgi:uncharacterized damage-inducible protein DinB
LNSYLPSVIKQFEYHKSLGDKAFSQLSFEDLQNEVAKDTNAIAIIVKHLVGNMHSRWTNFLTEDGEKEWRHRDEEFETTFTSKIELQDAWQKGWDCLFEAVKLLSNKNLEQVIFIRNQEHTVTEAVNRQMMHYAYHVGQIVLLAKLIKGGDWECLSIPKGQSKAYNKATFENAKIRKHFTDDL